MCAWARMFVSGFCWGSVLARPTQIIITIMIASVAVCCVLLGVCKVFQTVQRGYTYPPLSGPQLRQFACVSTSEHYRDANIYTYVH